MKQYTGTAYIGVVGGDLEYGTCRDSIEKILRQPDDAAPTLIRATKGYEARQMHVNNFIESHHNFLMMLDHDMTFPRDALVRLRSHGLPYVTGAYMRRQYQPMAPVWFKHNPKGFWPHEPDTTIPDKLVKVGASGWGCVLIHREVILAVRALLKGEQEVIEDDMDIWPYDLERVMGALNGLQALVDDKPQMRTLRPALEAHTKALREEIRPLRGKNDPVGSDIRFPWFAKRAGYDLWLDPGVQCGHILHYPVTTEDFLGAGEEARAEWSKAARRATLAARRDWRQTLAVLEGAE
jgi:hypothetical protein